MAVAFKDIYSEEVQLSNFLKLPPVGTELFHADGHRDGSTDGRTDMTELIIPFRKIAKARKKYHLKSAGRKFSRSPQARGVAAAISRAIKMLSIGRTDSQGTDINV